MSWSTIFHFDSLKPNSIVTASYNVCPSQQFFNILFFWRVLSLLLTLATCATNVIHQVHMHKQQWEFFLSFTNLCFIFMAVYFLAAALLSFDDWRKKRYAYFISVPGGNSTTESLLFGSQMDDEELQVVTPAPRSHRVFWVMFEVSFSFAIFIEVMFFWSALHSGSPDVFVFLLHAVNGVLMLGELLFNSLIFVASHIVFVWILLLLYTIEVFIWHAVDGRWPPYPYLESGDKMAFAFYPMLFVAASVTFMIGYFLVKLRDRRKGKPFAKLDIQDAPQFVF
eukprot:Phypoly_transcript_14525.p1 GENE.Phypoly_transcript_14525~~Phypoly_transcript_14525.p1  ORF type:complete len:281 (+),score=29.16 Phypoly_transcript_14525:101-943(+)